MYIYMYINLNFCCCKLFFFASIKNKKINKTVTDLHVVLSCNIKMNMINSDFDHKNVNI